MLRTFKCLELVLENCEVITLNPKDIRCFYLGDISTEIYSLHQRSRNTIRKSNVCNDFYVDILDYDNVYYTSNEEKQLLKLSNRLKSRDITAIRIQFEDNSSESYETSWAGQYYTNYNVEIITKEKYTRIAINNKFSIRKFLFILKRRFNMKYA